MLLKLLGQSTVSLRCLKSTYSRLTQFSQKVSPLCTFDSRRKYCQKAKAGHASSICFWFSKTFFPMLHMLMHRLCYELTIGLNLILNTNFHSRGGKGIICLFYLSFVFLVQLFGVYQTSKKGQYFLLFSKAAEKSLFIFLMSRLRPIPQSGRQFEMKKQTKISFHFLSFRVFPHVSRTNKACSVSSTKQNK